MYAKTSVSSVNTIIGDTIEYEVHIIYKKDIEYKYEDVSFDDRDNKCRIISVENKNRDIGEYKERIIKYQIGFYDVGQFVIFPFKISYNYNNKYEELYGEDVTVLVYPFSDGEVLPPMKNTIGLKMPKYVWGIIVLIAFAIVGIIILIFAIVKYIEKKFNEKINIKEDTEALNSLKNMDSSVYYNEGRYAEYYFELTFIFKRYLTKRFKFNICDLLRNIAFVSYSQNYSFRNGKGERAVANIKAGKPFFNKKYFGAKNSSLVPYSITKKTESFEYPKNNTHSSNACKNSNYYFPHTLTDIFNYFFCLILSLSTHLARSYLTASRCLRPMSTARRITSCLASPRFSHAKFMFLSVFSVNRTGVGAINFPLFSNIFIQKTVLNSYTKAN